MIQHVRHVRMSGVNNNNKMERFNGDYAIERRLCGR